VLIPLSAVFLKPSTLNLDQFWAIISAPRVVASYQLTFGAALLAALINAVFGLIFAWAAGALPLSRQADRRCAGGFAVCACRPRWPGSRSLRIYSSNGWLGQWLEPLGIKVAFTRLGVLVALIFVGLPFVVRTVQPVLEDLDTELEEAAASLGADRGQTFLRVVLPVVMPALLTGFAMAFARAVGEYGSVIFIAGNMPMVSEITPLIIITKLEQFDYVGATAIAVVMLVTSFILLFIINGLQAWANRSHAGA
jgi:sulfate transport system permease protein